LWPRVFRASVSTISLKVFQRGMVRLVEKVAGEWATKEEAIALVKREVVVITERGPKKAYAEITRQFHDRDLYITVIDLDGKVLAHGQRGNLIGRNLINPKDPDGKLFIKERVERASNQLFGIITSG
jgi:cytochrome c